jgi:predicted GH43/DUF377 family glycosyl hydrolase
MKKILFALKMPMGELMFKLTRYNQPVLKPQGSSFEAKAVFNPAVIKKDENVFMLYRAVGDLDSNISNLGLAISKDGIHFERISDVPVISANKKETKGGVEDPRVVLIDDTFYITYVAVPQQVLFGGKSPEHRDMPLITSAGLFTTKDFKTFEDKGIITPSNADDKDVVLFPEKINGKFAMLHRPFFWSQNGIHAPESQPYKIDLPFEKELLPNRATTWLSYSEDLYNWTDHVVMNDLVSEHDNKIGPGVPPIKTPQGWLVIYHRVEIVEEGNLYSAKAALLDLENPAKVLSVLPYDILRPEMDYEKEGFIKNVVFPTGAYIEGDTIFVYYGAADTVIGLATGSISELLKEFDVYRKNL